MFFWAGSHFESVLEDLGLERFLTGQPLQLPDLFLLCAECRSRNDLFFRRRDPRLSCLRDNRELLGCAAPTTTL